jgi:glycosyltransferase involved in cell wall biosynthesis
MGLVRAKGYPVKLVLVGPHTQEHIESAKNLGILQECVFVGPATYEKVPAYINACDIMVAPYNPSANSLRRAYGIGFPLKLLEYMACEKPFVSTRVDPIQQIPSVDEAGVLVEPGDPRGLAESIIALAKDEGARLRMGQTGRTLVEKGFSWAPLAERISSMIQSA